MKPFYGYELIQNLQEFGFIKGQAPPGMIYRHLRQLEEDGLVLSKWMTEGSGPAKRMHEITAEGGEILGLWADFMRKQAENIQKFVGMYTDCLGKKGSRSFRMIVCFGAFLCHRMSCLKKMQNPKG